MPRLSILLLAALNCVPLFGQTTNQLAPGAPGLDAHWLTAAKNGFGTSNTVASKIWFTLADGVMTEVFYPTLDVPNTQALQFIICRNGNCLTEREDMDHALRVVNSDALSFRQINTAPNAPFGITKSYTTDVERASILIDVSFFSQDNASYQLYLYYDPSLNNSGMHDTAWNTPQALFASDGNITSALISDAGFDETSSGYAGSSDGLTELKTAGVISRRYQLAENGNVAQVAKLRSARRFTVALAFGANKGEAFANAQLSLRKGFERARHEYESGWHKYVSSLRKVDDNYQRQFNMAAMALKALEDKTHRGAMIASPSNPWGAGPNANEQTTTGYHAVWSRDLYHVATAFIAMGDRVSANRALDFLFNEQQKPDGSFPQNSRVDGRPIGTALQMDQVAFPILLADQLGRTDGRTWRKHIKPAADFILRKGPATEQERWEEEPGYSPSTIAAEIAGLVCAARIARLNDDQRSATVYLARADEWAGNVEKWTATRSGPDGRHYFLRVTQNDDPDDGASLNINSGGGDYDERAIVDAGFLELVRLGIKRPDDPLIRRSLDVVDRAIKIETPHGAAWYRYNHDAYGERDDGRLYDGQSGRGRCWPLLTGERGQYEIALGNRAQARHRLRAMMGFANGGGMIPEQIWDRRESPRKELRFGEGTGSATPLGWSMAQFIRLAIAVRDGQNPETPDTVKRRYTAGWRTGGK